MGSARYSIRDEIKDTAESFYRAVSSKNLKAIDAVWAHEPYAAVAGRSGHLRQGWNSVRSYWEERFVQLGDIKVSARLRNFSCHVVGDVAWLSGTELRAITADGQVRHEELRMTSVMERRGTGWQIVSYHVSEPASQVPELVAVS
jgi:ketosteroid isomerase-like protein